MANKLKPLVLEDVRIVFRNFSGNEGPFNKLGDRNFGLLVDPDSAEAMEADGWNIKYLKPREEGDEQQAWLKVKVNFNGRPPKVMLVTSKSKTQLDESMVSIVDWAQIATVDLIISPYDWTVNGKSGITLIISPYDWTVNGKSGITAYLTSMFVTIEEDELDRKYANVPDTAQNTIGRELENKHSDPFNGEIEDLGERQEQLALDRGF
jgi:hypothetical protein